MKNSNVSGKNVISLRGAAGISRQGGINFSSLFLYTKKSAFRRIHLHFVELPGFEPGSKQSAKSLSTCVFSC